MSFLDRLRAALAALQQRFNQTPPVIPIATVRTAPAPVNPSSATKLGLTTQPSTTATNAVAFGTQPVIQIQDASGNPISQLGTVITVSIASGGGTLGGTLTATTNSSGVATFSGLKITGTVGARTLAFAASGLTGVTSGTVTTSAGAASQLGITTQPSTTATNATAFATQPVIQLQDVSGNSVLTSGVTVTASIASGGGTLGGTTTASTNSSGVATFSGLKITGTIGGRTLTFAVAGLTSATSGTITVSAGSATKLAITTQPSGTATTAIPFAQQPVIQLQDVSSNNVSQSSVTVTAAIGTGSDTLGGTTTATTNSSGVATYTNLQLTGSGSDTLTFSATSLTSVTSSTISVSSVAPFISETFAWATSTANLRSSAADISNGGNFITSEAVNTANITLDQTVGYAPWGTTQSMKYVWPPSAANDYGMTLGFMNITEGVQPSHGTLTEWWWEVALTFAPTFNTDGNPGSSAGSEYKLFLGGPYYFGSNRVDCPDMQPAQWVYDAPGTAPTPAVVTAPTSIWDGNPHLMRGHWKIGHASNGILAFSVDGVTQFNATNLTWNSDNTALHIFRLGANMNRGSNSTPNTQVIWWHGAKFYKVNPGWGI